MLSLPPKLLFRCSLRHVPSRAAPRNSFWTIHASCSQHPFPGALGALSTVVRWVVVRTSYILYPPFQSLGPPAPTPKEAPLLFFQTLSVTTFSILIVVFQRDFRLLTITSLHEIFDSLAPRQNHLAPFSCISDVFFLLSLPTFSLSLTIRRTVCPATPPSHGAVHPFSVVPLDCTCLGVLGRSS